MFRSVWRWAAIFAAGACLAQPPAQDRTVVLISIDALPASAFDDPRLPVPTLHRLMREGASARAMRVSNPTVTWPSHTSMVTGVWPATHGVLFNGLLMRQNDTFKVEPWRNKTDMVRAPTVYDAGARRRAHHRAGGLGSHLQRPHHHLGVRRNPQAGRGGGARHDRHGVADRGRCGRLCARPTSPGATASGPRRRPTSCAATSPT